MSEPRSRPIAVVAVDGPAAAGKGTLARRLAADLDFAFLDTGLLYRATAMHLAEAGRRASDLAAAEAAARQVNAADLSDNPALPSLESANQENRAYNDVRPGHSIRSSAFSTL